MPVNRNPKTASSFDDGFDVRAAHKFEDRQYVMPPAWEPVDAAGHSYELELWIDFMDNVAVEFINAEVAKMDEQRQGEKMDKGDMVFTRHR